MCFLSAKLIYISSTSYTGSTLLSILMGSHKDIVTISELTGLIPNLKASEYKCSCEKVMTDCDFWLNIQSEFKKFSGKNLDLSDFQTHFFEGSNGFFRKLFYGSLHSNNIERFRGFIASRFATFNKNVNKWLLQNYNLIKACEAVSGKKNFLDASKSPSRIPYLKKIKDHELHIIHLVRDVRGFVNSSRKNKGQSISKAAKFWVRVHKDIERLALYSNQPYIRIRYEDLCNNPDKIMHEIYDFLSLDHDSIRFNPSEQHLLGNRMRLRKNLDINLDEKWRTELTKAEKALAFKISESLSIRYGYAGEN